MGREKERLTLRNTFAYHLGVSRIGSVAYRSFNTIQGVIKAGRISGAILVGEKMGQLVGVESFAVRDELTVPLNV